ncbi:hypothetical protein Cni_G29289 [Canna indica]|uniref:Abscisic acid receptor PYL8 n=1 Tax=Canna indica TaxID=4628 RepID=A0AAQ3L4V9_9LILI|nr:hypothetical protein Cni_G29289 [Canna indica]
MGRNLAVQQIEKCMLDISIDHRLILNRPRVNRDSTKRLLEIPVTFRSTFDPTIGRSSIDNPSFRVITDFVDFFSQCSILDLVLDFGLGIVLIHHSKFCMFRGFVKFTSGFAQFRQPNKVSDLISISGGNETRNKLPSRESLTLFYRRYMHLGKNQIFFGPRVLKNFKRTFVDSSSAFSSNRRILGTTMFTYLLAYVDLMGKAGTHRLRLAMQKYTNHRVVPRIQLHKCSIARRLAGDRSPLLPFFFPFQWRVGGSWRWSDWMNGGGSGGLRLMEEEYVRRYHRQEITDSQCSSTLVKHIRAPVHLVWSLVRSFDQPQKYKPFISRCVVQGDLEIGSVREVNVKSGLPATTSTERLELLDDNEHVLCVKIVGGDHRLRNYSSIITVHPEVIDGRPGTLVIESFVVDVPDGNTKDETCYFVEALIKCNLKSLAEVSERLAVQSTQCI